MLDSSRLSNRRASKNAMTRAIAALVLALGFCWGCDETGQSDCTASDYCDSGLVCRDGKCVERQCYSRKDCSTDEVCVSGLSVGQNPDLMYCSASCSDTNPCAGAGKVCVGGICKQGNVTNDIVGDMVDPEDVVRDDTAQDLTDPDVTVQDVSGELPPIDEINDCKTCTATGDCGTGYTCQPVGAEKHCLRDCINDGDCMAGYTCYASGSQKSCLPVSYNCVACTFDTPCDEGKCCDFSTGTCKDCRGECFTCTYDYDCEPGLRCYKQTGDPMGVCVPECGETDCRDTTNYACADNGKGVEICTPKTEGCGGCADPTPYPLDGGCVACRNNDDCGEDKMCNTTDHTCVDSKCTGDTIMCEADMKCHQCCVDDDCLKYPEATGVCNPDGTCDGVVACGGLCTEDFPVCAVVQGVEQCVQCATDEDCAMINSGCTCVGDPLYSCVDETGAICQAIAGSCASTCEDAGDCPPTSTGGAMECAMINGGTTGLCFDPTGTCDGSSSCCAPGKKCYDIMLLLMSGMMGGAGGLPIDPSMMQSGSGYCECTTADECLSGKACTDMAIMCVVAGLTAGFGDMICPGGQLSPSFPPKMCLDFQDLLNGII